MVEKNRVDYDLLTTCHRIRVASPYLLATEVDVIHSLQFVSEKQLLQAGDDVTIYLCEEQKPAEAYRQTQNNYGVESTIASHSQATLTRRKAKTAPGRPVLIPCVPRRAVASFSFRPCCFHSYRSVKLAWWIR